MNDDVKKRSLGQFFTKNHYWLHTHIVDFIKSSNKKIAFDPFAGAGDLLKVATDLGFKKIKGLDIDRSLKWDINDSLINIPNVKDSIIITNPPYLTNYSAKRKGIYNNVAKYFESCSYDDIYQLALDRCFENNDYGIAIIPETFINSNFPKNRLINITVIEKMMFNDTENPICVICFDNKIKPLNKINLYKNDKFLGNLQKFENMRKIPNKQIPIKFNSLSGNIALRAVDTTNIDKPIEFLKPENIDYDLSTIKVSSRLITLIELNIENKTIDKLIKMSNSILNEFRKNSEDILLSPFKGNKKNGERRRRLDYHTARAILEESYNNLIPSNSLF